MKVSQFEVHGGSRRVEGKSNWPDVLTITMEPFFAWEIVRQLLSQLKRDEKNIEFSHCGKLNYDVEEE